MNNRMELAQDRVIESIGNMCNKFGLNNVMAQLYIVLYLRQNSLSLDDMVELLKISKATASINIRKLEQYGVVRRVWVKGSRKDHYEAETDISKVIIDRIKSLLKGRLLDFDDMINSAFEILDSVNPRGGEEEIEAKVFRQRMLKLKDIHIRMQSIFNFFDSGSISNLLAAGPENSHKEEVLAVK